MEEVKDETVLDDHVVDMRPHGRERCNLCRTAEHPRDLGGPLHGVWQHLL